MSIINCYDFNGVAIRCLTQWDHDVSVHITGVNTDPVPEFRFSNKKSKKAICIGGIVTGDGLKSVIPNELLREAVPVYAQLFYKYPSGDAKTEYTFVIPVKPACMPDGEVYEPSEVKSFAETVARLERLEKNIPKVPDWALQSSKPAYTASEVGADPKGTAESAVSDHDTNLYAHGGLRRTVQSLTERINAALDSDDTTLDQLSEIVAYIKSNKSLIDAITTAKVSVADIVNDTTTDDSSRPLSAAMGMELRRIIRELEQAAEETEQKLDALANGIQGGTGGNGSGQNPYELPVGGDELGGVKNGGNVTINADGTMTAPDNAPTDEQVSNAVGEYLDEHPELATTVADRSITVAKTTFIEPVVQNLIDISKVVKGNQSETGIQPGGTPGGAGYTTDYIPVEVGKTYRCNIDFGSGGWMSSWYYDPDKNPLSVIPENPFTVPEGVAYARLTWYYNDDPAVKKYALFEGENLWPFTQGIQRYELDAMLTKAVERVVDAYAAVKAVPKNLYKQAGYGNVNGSTGVIDCGDAGSLRVSDYIEITPGVFYISNCLSAPGFTACYDADKNYVAAFPDAAERIDISGYYGFRVTDPNVRYIVNGCEKTISKPISDPFICRGSYIPESLEGWDVAVPHSDVVDALKKLLGVSGNELAGLTWAVLGDSITAASGSTKSYHGIIAAKLGMTAINYGYNGSWVSYTDAMPEGNEMCTRYATMTDDADLITVDGGTNDINNKATLGRMGDTEKNTFYGALDILCQGLLAKYPGKRIAYITPLNYGNDSAAAPYIKAIFEVCTQYGIPVIDLHYHGPFAGAPAEIRGVYLYDGLHPNEAGHEAMACYIGQQLEWL